MAPSTEQEQVYAALGLWKNEADACQARLKAFEFVHPDYRDTEQAYLNAWVDRINAEDARLHAWARDLHNRQLARGVLVPQVDGTFARGDAPADPVTAQDRAKVIGLAAARLGGAGALYGLRAFLDSKFRTKLAVIGLGLIAFAFVISGTNPPAAAWCGGIGGLLLVIWFFSALGADKPQPVAAASAPQGGGYSEEAEIERLKDEIAQQNRLADRTAAELQAEADRAAAERHAERLAAERNTTSDHGRRWS
ncbi:hypothetical protein KIH27_15925 [Mycobacterium sp. M1]|uniref:Uncharacterized protein n=1 Tax=Mycolicibacter acidiphilus TaxID=2835306 RepID=A0ABS5RLH8_9MYCO|nr:hypothetical protein [Mycolicibacter acidiphilus]MBS9535076.1 hypothetical protein [Mycolicibacter acidiphilus]